MSPSPRIPLWHPKSPALPKPSSQIRKQRAKFQGENRQTLQEFCFAEFLESLHRAANKTGVSRRKSRKPANHPRIRCKPNSGAFVPLQRETQCLWQNLIAKALWHLKSPALSKAVSPSPRIQLALNSVIRTPASNKEGTAYGGPGALWHQKSHYLPKAPSQSRTQPAEFQSENRHIIPEFGASRIPEFWHMAFAQDRAVQVPKRLSLKVCLLY